MLQARALLQSLSRHTTRSYLLIFLQYVHTWHCFLIASESFCCATEARSVSYCNSERLLLWSKVVALGETIFCFPQLRSLVRARFHRTTSDWQIGKCHSSSFQCWMKIFSSQAEEIRKTVDSLPSGSSVWCDVHFGNSLCRSTTWLKLDLYMLTVSLKRNTYFTFEHRAIFLTLFDFLMK